MEPKIHLRNFLILFISIAFVSLLINFTQNVHLYWFLYTIPILIASASYGVGGALVVSLICVALITRWLIQGIYPGTIIQSPIDLRLEITIGMSAIFAANVALGYFFNRWQKQHALLERLSIHDRLTGLYNYSYFVDSLSEEIKRAKRYETPLSLIMIDIDFFKEFNDCFGHERGNEVLRKIAATLLKQMRGIDIVARYGGEEFAIVLPNIADEALTVAERLRKKVEELKFFGNDENPEVKKTISLGVAIFPCDAASETELVVKADQALYLAKQSGRNQVCSY